MERLKLNFIHQFQVLEEQEKGRDLKILNIYENLLENKQIEFTLLPFISLKDTHSIRGQQLHKLTILS